MGTFAVTLHSQEALDERGRLQSHQWAEIPDDLAVVYMTGGLKRVRRMVESYTRFDSMPGMTRWVRAAWHRGEPTILLRYVKKPLLHLGRLRQAGTVDAYRGHLEILGGSLIAPEAIASPLPWPADLPWAAPSAGEFDIKAEQQRPPYLGVFEFRVYRRPSGCSAHIFVRDLPQAHHGIRAKLWSRPWMPLTRLPSLGSLRTDVLAAANQLGQQVQFEMQEHEGVPEPLPQLRPVEQTFSALVGPGPG